MDFDDTYDLNQEYLSGLTSLELVDVLNSHTMHFLTAIHEKKKDQVSRLKSVVEKIQEEISQRKKSGDWQAPSISTLFR